jgi:hypothetical protein
MLGVGRVRRRLLPRPLHYAQAPAVLDHSRALAQRDGRARPALDRSPIGRECDLIILNAGDAVAAGKWWMAWAQSISQSVGVLRFGPPDGAMTLPSGPITGSRSGRETLVSACSIACDQPGEQALSRMPVVRTRTDIICRCPNRVPN